MRILRLIYQNSLINKVLAFIYFKLRDSYDQYIYSAYIQKYKIDPTFKFRGTEITFFGEGDIKIGQNSYILRYSILEASEGCMIIIGDNCAIGPYVKMYTKGRLTDQDLNQNPSSGKLKYMMGDITIGNGCWIGANVAIKGGVTIGDNSIIGMNSVVTRDIPPCSIAVGSPAKVVKFKSNISKEKKIKMVHEYENIDNKLKDELI